MDNKITYQKLKREYNDEFTLAEMYFSLVSVLNNLKLTERDIQLVAFAAIRGNISDYKFRREFCEKYKTSFPTINNIKSKLRAVGVLVKEEKKTVVNPILVLKFKQNVVLEIKLLHEEGSKSTSV